MKITRQEIDIAGNYRYWVEILDGEEIMLKYNSEQTDEDVIAEGERQLAIRNYVPPPLWHDNNCNIQIKMSIDNSVRMMAEYPEMGLYCKMNNIATYFDEKHTYNYVNTLYDEHRYLLEMYGAEIIERE
jgi:hypothetical protein